MAAERLLQRRQFWRSLAFNALRLQYYHEDIGFAVVLPGPVATDMLKTPQPLPFTHQPADEARYIVDAVLAGKKHIEPSWFY